MTTTTFHDMDLSDLGDNAAESDLAAFKRACVLRNQEEDETDEQTTEWMFGQGDWIGRACKYVKGWNPNDDAKSWGDDESWAEAIRSGDCDY